MRWDGSPRIVRAPEAEIRHISCICRVVQYEILVDLGGVMTA